MLNTIFLADFIYTSFFILIKNESEGKKMSSSFSTTVPSQNPKPNSFFPFPFPFPSLVLET